MSLSWKCWSGLFQVIFCHEKIDISMNQTYSVLLVGLSLIFLYNILTNAGLVV